jgi:hypothetical protein
MALGGEACQPYGLEAVCTSVCVLAQVLECVTPIMPGTRCECDFFADLESCCNGSGRCGNLATQQQVQSACSGVWM